MTSPKPSRRQRLARTRLYRALLRRLTPDMLAVQGTPRSDRRFANLPLPGEVVVYFPDDATKIYQLEQWLPVLDQVHARHPVLLVTRNLGSFRRLQELTTLPLIFTRRLRDLNAALLAADPAVCLYVNNSSTNFQVLGWARALHLHLNHGESDKISMASNQAKAYDQVLVAGPAAVQRYADNLLALDLDRLVTVGRPQLDLDFPPVLAPSARPTVLYAPTWEGEMPAMDYTSLTRFGPALVERLLHAGFRVVYKPHPKIVTGTAVARTAHAAVLAVLAAYGAPPAVADGAGQQVRPALPAAPGAGGPRVRPAPDTGAAAHGPHDPAAVDATGQPVLSLFGQCDVLVSDVSSVALDWLYLRTEQPLWLTDVRGDREALVHASPLAARTYVLDAEGVPDAAALLQDSLSADPLAGERTEARTYYFADLQPGESTRRFLETVDAAVARRAALLAEKVTGPHAYELEPSAA